jgi:Amt family ammonium transporter
LLRRFSIARVDAHSLTIYRDYIAHLDGVTIIRGGWLNHNYRQLGIQLAGGVTGGAYSFFGSLIILYTMDFVGKYLTAFRLRASPEEEDLGIDDVEIGEFAVCLEFACPMRLD